MHQKYMLSTSLNFILPHFENTFNARNIQITHSSVLLTFEIINKSASIPFITFKNIFVII